jgi:hypothetical protein
MNSQILSYLTSQKSVYPSHLKILATPLAGGQQDFTKISISINIY